MRKMNPVQNTKKEERKLSKLLRRLTTTMIPVAKDTVEVMVAGKAEEAFRENIPWEVSNQCNQGMDSNHSIKWGRSHSMDSNQCNPGMPSQLTCRTREAIQIRLSHLTTSRLTCSNDFEIDL